MPTFLDKIMAAEEKQPELTFLDKIMQAEPVTSQDYIKEDRGFVGDVVSRAARGGLGLVEGVAGGMRMTDVDPTKETNFVSAMGLNLSDWSKEARKKYDIFKPDIAEVTGKEGFFKRGLGGTFESAPLSLSTLAGGYAGAKIGAAAGGVIGGPPGAVIGATAGAVIGAGATLFGTFGMGQYQTSYDEAEKFNRAQGLSEDEIKAKSTDYAWTNAVYEVGTEAVGDLAAFTFFGVFGKQAIKQGLKQTVRQILSPGGIKEFSKALVKTIPFETSSEMVAGYGQTKAAQELGMTEMTPIQGMVESIIPATLMSIMFGAGIYGLQAYEASATLKALNGDDYNARYGAATKIAKRLDPDDAVVWMNTAKVYVDKDEPIPFSAPIIDYATQKKAQEETDARTVRGDQRRGLPEKGVPVETPPSREGLTRQPAEKVLRPGADEGGQDIYIQPQGPQPGGETAKTWLNLRQVRRLKRLGYDYDTIFKLQADQADELIKNKVTGLDFEKLTEAPVIEEEVKPKPVVPVAPEAKPVAHVEPVTPEPAAPEGKAPWEMTAEEFALNQGKPADNKYVQQQRRAIIKKALSEGKPVPPEVLADYPDLKPAAPKTKSEKYIRIGDQSVDKPQGLYLAKEGSDIIGDIEGEKVTYDFTPKNPLPVEPELIVDHARGGGLSIPASSGIKALKKLVGEKEFSRLMKLSKSELQTEFAEKHPDVNWGKYYDSYEMLEGYAGTLAREKGYDSFVGDPDEVVVLDRSIINAKPAPAAPAPKPAAPELKTYDDAQAYIDKKASEYGSKKKFYESDEYKQIYPEIKRLFKEHQKKLGVVKVYVYQSDTMYAGKYLLRREKDIHGNPAYVASIPKGPGPGGAPSGLFADAITFDTKEDAVKAAKDAGFELIEKPAAPAPKPTPEYISGMALQTKDGKTISGETFGIEARTHADLWDRLSQKEKNNIKSDDGVVTNKGRYLTREEAVELITDKTKSEQDRGTYGWDANQLINRPVGEVAPTPKPAAPEKPEKKPTPPAEPTGKTPAKSQPEQRAYLNKLEDEILNGVIENVEENELSRQLLNERKDLKAILERRQNADASKFKVGDGVRTLYSDETFQNASDKGLYRILKINPDRTALLYRVGTARIPRHKDTMVGTEKTFHVGDLYRDRDIEKYDTASGFKKRFDFESAPQKKEEAIAKEGEPAKPVSVKQPEIEPKVEITGAKEKEVTVDIPKKEADALTPKEQKKYLLAEIDAAIKEAPEGYFDSGLTESEWDEISQLGNRTVAIVRKQKIVSEKQKKFGTVTIHVSGDGDFTILNTKSALQEFKKKAGSFPVSELKPPAPKMPAMKSEKRIMGEGIEYYNEYQPHKVGIVYRDEKNFYKDGYFSDGGYAIETGTKPKIQKPYAESAPDIKSFINDIGKSSKKPAEIVAELYEGYGPFSQVMAHIKTKDGDVEAFVRADYIDSVLTKYPDAKPYMKGAEYGIAFKVGKKTVAVVMPFRIDRDLSENIQARMKGAGVQYATAETPTPTAFQETKSIPIDIQSLSKEILSRMNRTLKAKGYDVRGADDIKFLLESGSVARAGKLFHPDWIEAYQKAIEGKEKRVEKQAAKNQFANINWERIRQLGKTTNLKEAGYIAPDGSLVDLSGKQEGGQPGTRSYDHREAGGTTGMRELMAYGYIRMDSNSGMIDIAKAPTNKQYQIIRDLASNQNGEVIIELDDGLGEFKGEYYSQPDRHFYREYPTGTKPARILNDIKTFFAGEDPRPMRNLPQYSIRIRPGIAGPLTLEAIQSLPFTKPGTVLQHVDGTFSVSYPGNNGFAIQSVDDITEDEIAFKAAYGQKRKPTQKIVGSYTHEDKTVRITKLGDKWTVTHEFEHFLEKSGLLTRREIFALEKQSNKYHRGEFTGYEGRARWIEHELQAREHARDSLIGRIIQKIADILDGFVNLFTQTGRGAIRAIESGKAAMRPVDMEAINEFAQPVAFSLKDAVKSIMDNPNFKKWFSGSKVVGDNGEPLVVYHGSEQPAYVQDHIDAINEIAKIAGIKKPPTIAEVGFTWEKSRAFNDAIDDYIDKNRDSLPEDLVLRVQNIYRDIESFDPNLLGKNTGAYDTQAGFFFTPDKDFARRFTYQVEVDMIAGKKIGERVINKTKPKIYEVYLSIQNPVELHKITKAKAQEYFDANLFQGLRVDDIYNMARSTGGSKDLQRYLSVDKQRAINAGYDGIFNTVRDEQGKIRQEIVAFNPIQIKSIYNRGAFSPTDPRILYTYAEINATAADNLDTDTNSLLEHAGKLIGRVKVAKEKPDLSYFGDLVASIPEFFKQKIYAVGKMVKATYDQRDEFNELVFNFENHDNTNVAVAFKDLNKQDNAGYVKVQDHLVGEDRDRHGYRLEFDKDNGKWRVVHPDTGHYVDEFKSTVDEYFIDTGEVQAAESSMLHEAEDLQALGWTPQQVNAVKAFRMSTNKGFFLLTADMRRLKKRFADAKMPEPKITTRGEDGKPTKISIDEAMAIMGDMRGYYFPRIRERGNYMLTAHKKGELSKKETFKFNIGPIGYRKRALEKDGWKVDVKAISKVGEDVFALSGELIKTQQLINAALERIEKTPSVEFDKEEIKKMFDESEAIFSTALAEQLSNIIRERGSRVHMTKRVEKVYTGYEEDPAIAIAKYIRGLAGGEAKRNMAVKLLRAFTGTELSFAEFKDQNPDTGWEEYQAHVREMMIDQTKQPWAFKWGLEYIKHVTRNPETADEVIGFLRGMGVAKFLAFRVFSAPLVNVTAMPTSVVATMKGAGIPYMRTWRLIGKAAWDYGMYRAGKTKNETRKIFDYIRLKGWDNAQFNSEALASLRSTLGRKYDKIIEWGMFTFAESERLNRAATIAGTYRGLAKLAKHKGKSFEDLMDLAKEVSDKAHAVYAKGNDPYFAMGGNPAAQVAQMFYVFRRFSHSYLMNMRRLGFEERDLGAVTHMVLAPAVIAGAGASVMTPIIGAMLKGFGYDDPEEEMYYQVGKTFGETGETLARFGGLGIVPGISAKGSLAIGITDVPTSIADIAGAPGSVLDDIFIKGIPMIARGDVSKGFEKILPTGFGNILRARREAKEGITTKTNLPLFYGNEVVKPTAAETFYRALSFYPERIAKIREKQYREFQTADKYTKRRSEIYARMRKLILDDNGDKSTWAKLYAEVAEYNEDIIGLNFYVPLITNKSIKANTNLKRIYKPSKRERMRQ